MSYPTKRVHVVNFENLVRGNKVIVNASNVMTSFPKNFLVMLNQDGDWIRLDKW